jgi:sugar lactone lactonase YvrE
MIGSEPLTTHVVLADLHFAENLRWRGGRLWFSDMYGDKVHAYDPGTEAHEIVGELFHPAGLGWLPDGRLLAVASEDRLVFVVSPDGNELYADLSGELAAWANEMLVTGDGRAYVGNFGYDLFNEEMRPTHLVLIDVDRSVTCQPGDLRFPNGMALTADGRLVVAETFGPSLALFDVAQNGSLTRAGAIDLDEDLTPDGICVDAEAGIWLASPLTKEVVYVTAGGVVHRHRIDTAPYACMLGGSDRRTLYIAVAPDHEPAQRRSRAEGQIVACTVDVHGVGPDGLGGGVKGTSRHDDRGLEVVSWASSTGSRLTRDPGGESGVGTAPAATSVATPRSSTASDASRSADVLDDLDA